MKPPDPREVESLLYAERLADEKARLFDEAKRMADEREEAMRERDNGSGPRAGAGPTWQIVAQIVSSAFLALGAWLLQGIKTQSEANGLAIVAIQTELSQRVQRADAEHARFQKRDEELFEAIRALNDKLDQERIERIRGERR